MKHIKFFILLTFSLVSFVLSDEYHIDKSKSNMVKFISDAPLEDFEGITDKIDGYIYWEDENMLAQSQMYFEVDLNSLDTGIGLRNRHMRENYLETNKYPLTHFKGQLTSATQSSNNSYQVTAQGVMFIHGVENEITVEGTMIPVEDGFRIQTEFITTLTDYNIEVPQLMFFKIDEHMRLKLDFYIKRYDKNE